MALVLASQRAADGRSRQGRYFEPTDRDVVPQAPRAGAEWVRLDATAIF